MNIELGSNVGNPSVSNTYRHGRRGAQRIVQYVKGNRLSVGGVEIMVAQFHDAQWYLIPAEAEHDKTHDPIGPYPNPESALVALRLSADPKEEE